MTAERGVIQKHSKYRPCQRALERMGEEVIRTRAIGACSHGGIYSVNPRLVRLDCSSSISPLGAPKKAIAAVKMMAKSLIQTYPDPECRELKESLSHYLGFDPEWISLGNGAVEIIYWFAYATSIRGRVVIPAPTFCEYELASQMVGAEVTFVPLDNFDIDANRIIEKAKGANALFLCNPNNPTGMLATKQIIKIIKNIDNSTRVLLDECFVELTDNPDANTLIDKVSEFDNLVILRSLTKSFGLAGLRIGYSICNPTLAKKLSKNKIPWNVNTLAQVAGVAALLERRRYLSKVRALVKKERMFLHDNIEKLDSFHPIRSDSNFFLVHLHEGNSTHFRDRLLKKSGVLVRDCSTFTGMGTQYIRIAIKRHSQNMLLLKALEDFDYND